MNEVSERIRALKIVPVVVIKELSEAEGLLGALDRGGLPVAEVTFRTACAADAITLGVKKFPDMLIGAGTVINAEQCERAVACGAKFIVSPGLSEDVAAVCRKHDVPYYPGTVTPTEIMRALALGLTDLKFFPASDFGGLKTIKALAAAFPAVRFMPTGGINENNVLEYLGYDRIFACGGSWMTKGTPSEVEEKTKRAVALVGARGN